MTFWVLLLLLWAIRLQVVRVWAVCPPQDRLSTTFWARGLLLLLGLVTLAGDGWLQCPIAAALVLICAPGMTLRYVICPLHLTRTASWTVRLFWPLDCIGNVPGAAAFYAGLAMVGSSPTVSDLKAWSKHRERRSILGNFGTAAIALDGVFRKDLVTARAAFEELDRVSPRPWSRTVRRVAREWLVMDAARRGEWSRVVRLGRRGLDSHRCTYTIARIAERRLGLPGSLSTITLQVCCLVSPRSKALLQLLRESSPSVDIDLTSAPPAPVSNESDARHSAYAIFLKMSQPGCLTSTGTFQAVTLAVQRQVDSSELWAVAAACLVTSNQQRPADLQSVINGMKEELVELLIPAISARPEIIEGIEEMPLISHAVNRIVRSTLAMLAIQCRETASRVHREQSLDEASEWAAWARLRDAAERVIALSPHSKPLVVLELGALAPLAVLHHDKLRRIEFARAVFRWLMEHGDSRPDLQRTMAGNLRKLSQRS